MLARWLALLALLFATLLSERAVAQNATSAAQLARSVRVEPSTDRCLSEAVVRARVLKRLAQSASLSDVQVIVYVADPPHLAVLRGGQRIAERRFENFPVSCNARRDAIAVAVALAIERAREAQAAPATESSAPAATASTTPPVPAEAAPASTAGTTEPNSAPAAQEPTESSPTDETAVASSDSALRLGAHAGVATVLEILPGLAFAGVLGADVSLGDIRVSLSALASLEQRDDVLGASIDSQFLLGRALACGDLTQLGDFALEGCAGALAGAAFASGHGYDSDRSTELGYAAAMARAALRIPARGVVAARLALDGLAPFVRPSYVLREGASDQTTSVTPAPIGAALSVELALTLP